MLGHFKTISLALAINVIAGGAFAFAQNAIANRAADYKAAMVPGYDVTGIIFDINDTDPTFIDTITFHIAPSLGSAEANQVKIQTEANGQWTECTLVDDVLPTRVATCTFDALTAEDVTDLNITVK